MKNHRRLSKAVIASTSATVSDVWLTDDDGSRGGGRLVVRIGRSGSRHCYFRYSIGTGRVMLPIGEYASKATPGLLTLKEARELAIRYSAIHRNPDTRDVQKHLPSSELLGRSPRSSRPDSHSTDVSGEPNSSLLDLCNAYADGLVNRGAQSASAVKNYIKNHIAPTKWASCPARDISSMNIVELLRLLIEAKKGQTARKVRALLGAAFEQALQASLDPKAPGAMDVFGITFNPVAATASLSKFNNTLDRALSKSELGFFWAEAMSAAHDHSIVVRFIRLTILLGGQRGLQLLRVKTSAVDTDEPTITLLDGKGRRPQPRQHVLPLVPGALEEVKWLLQHSKSMGSPFLFAGKMPETALSNTLVSAAVRTISEPLEKSGKLKAHFCYGDIRRTTETNMAAIDIQKDVRAQILSHGLGGLQDRHYNRWDYHDQKLAALLKWEAYLNERRSSALRASEGEQN
jgi:integrase